MPPVVDDPIPRADDMDGLGDGEEAPGLLNGWLAIVPQQQPFPPSPMPIIE
jgi:hypothetical protein